MCILSHINTYKYVLGASTNINSLSFTYTVYHKLFLLPTVQDKTTVLTPQASNVSFATELDEFSVKFLR